LENVPPLNGRQTGSGGGRGIREALGASVLDYET